jgi:hypothetical protein
MRRSWCFFCVLTLWYKVHGTEKQRRLIVRLTTSNEWTEYFVHNDWALLTMPWELGAGVTAEELTAVGRSLQAWQLGETSEGGHLRAAARHYADKVGDPDFPETIEWFIREEQRHGETLGRFLDLAGMPRIRRNWGDSVFRAFRYALRGMELWVTVVIMVETLALVYYAAVRNATRSVLLRRICQQILKDEVPHIRFQYERLAILHSRRPRGWLWVTHAVHRVFFLGIVVAVWAGHHRALRAGGHTWGSYWGLSWRKMKFAWERMRPENYGVEKAEVVRAERRAVKAVA